MHKAAENSLMRQHADRVSADAQICGVSEAHHAAIAEDEIEADRGQRQNDDASEQRQHEAVTDEFGINRQQQQRRQQRDDGDGAEIQRGHHLLPVENRPSGLTTSTIAISR